MQNTVSFIVAFAFAIVAHTAHAAHAAHAAPAATDAEFIAGFRRDFPVGCMETAPAMGRTKPQIHGVCACVADRMLEDMGVHAVREVTEANVPPSPEIQERMKSYAEECAARPEFQPGAANAPTTMPPSAARSGTAVNSSAAYGVGYLLGRAIAFLLLAAAAWWVFSKLFRRERTRASDR